MINQNETKMQTRIKKIQQCLAALGEMRPGSLSKQFNVCGNPDCRCKDQGNPKKHGPYFQLSYSHKGKSTTEFVKEENLSAVEQQISNYREFKKLVEEWVDLSVEIAKLRKKNAIEKKLRPTRKK